MPTPPQPDGPPPQPHRYHNHPGFRQISGPPIRVISRQELLTLARRHATPLDPGLRYRDRQRVDALPILGLSAQDRAEISSAAQSAQSLLSSLFPDAATDTPDVLPFLEEAHRYASETFAEAAATRWGGNYVFPPDTLARDLAEFHSHGRSLPAVARARRAAQISTGFSSSRVVSSFGPDGRLHPALSPEDFQRLLRLATVGVEIPRPARFVPVPTPAPLRPKYLKVQSAVHRLLAKQAVTGTVLLLPLHVLRDHPGLHLHNSQHWARKKGKESGRSIADLSNTPDPDAVCPLNGHTATERADLTAECIRRYGPIRLPTLTELMLLILTMADTHGWNDLMLWKLDLQGAFNLLWINPSDVTLLGFPLAHDLVVVHLVGLFGWLGMPFAFNVLSRTLLILILAAISGRASMYVDDVMGCSTRSKLHADMTAAHDAITGLAGDFSVAPDKSESGRSLEFIGWTVCLDTRTVTVSRRILLKTAHAFFSFQLTDRLSQLHLQRMASLASRISTLCQYMRPFTYHLPHEAAQFSHNPSARHRISAAARSEVCIWRAFILILQRPGVVMHRPISSFRVSPPTFELHYDASLTQVAVGLYLVLGSARSLRVFAAPVLPFPTSSDSSKQNSYEYLAVVVGLLLAASIGISSASYTLYGDSISSLTWTESGRANSALAHKENLAVATISVTLNLDVASTVHVPGDLNTVYDGLSRGATAEEVGLDPALQVFFTRDHPVTQFMLLCEPTPDHLDPAAVTSLLGQFSALLRTLVP